MVDNFDVDETLISTESISGTVSAEMRRDALVAVAVAAVCMLIYIWFRFKDIRFASSAVLALLHDVLVVFAFYAISRTSVGNTFIAVMLTILGYSINATIVIFDRIRENLHEGQSRADLAEIVNNSITQTLTRSIYTSLTTFIMVAVLYVMGVSSIKEFAAPLMVGIVCGAYSSVCITGPLWLVMKRHFTKAGTQTAALAGSPAGALTGGIRLPQKIRASALREEKTVKTSPKRKTVRELRNGWRGKRLRKTLLRKKSLNNMNQHPGARILSRDYCLSGGIMEKWVCDGQKGRFSGDCREIRDRSCDCQTDQEQRRCGDGRYPYLSVRYAGRPAFAMASEGYGHGGGNSFRENRPQSQNQDHWRL